MNIINRFIFIQTREADNIVSLYNYNIILYNYKA